MFLLNIALNAVFQLQLGELDCLPNLTFAFA